MPKVHLPDGSTKEVPQGTPIGDALPEGSVAARVAGELVDLNWPVQQDVEAEPVDRSDPDGLRVLRHSTAHVMAQAVCDLYPGAKYAIGPPIEDGFYYDFELPESLTPEDLARIEQRMRAIAAEGQAFVREELDRGAALERFADQPYKKEIIDTAQADEGALGDRFSVYRNDGWADLCLGPHVPTTRDLGAFKLLSLAGAYWRGDEHRQQLQRIYGTAWATQEDLDAHLHRLEEAERRDHRKLGRQLDLFSFPDDVGAGLALWHPRGGILRRQLEDFVREVHVRRGYDLVSTPHLARAGVWSTSGHLAKYRQNMYPAMHEEEGGEYFAKPMNCPLHVLIYRSQTRSYRDLPMRLAELGTVYRYERPGTLHGLLRIRGLTIDDAHIFCRPDQLVDEILGVFDLTLEVHQTFGFTDPLIELSTRPGEAIGNEEMWAKATDTLRQALDQSGMEYRVAEGEGAFYGPKVDFHFRDAIGRLWQLTTVQCDFALPERFDIEYTGEDNERHRPVMIHRAILGSLERFTGVLIEHYAGAFPLWLAPEQVRLVPVADRHAEHARGLAGRLEERGLRAAVDDSRETVPKKIRAAELMKIPYTLVVGDKEIEAGTVAVRGRVGKEVRGVSFEPFVDAAATEAGSRSLGGIDLESLVAG
ncbi:MAG TPA: threonine--tRNA ligase, partial [Actinomycetota bacterium]|nr:threonine--tRNA ligase [Actinomycetota bacterium]